jgi:hypothetical protein
LEAWVGPKIGYLLPTRERVMEAKPAGGPLLQLSERAEALVYDSIWIGVRYSVDPGTSRR